MKLDRVTERSHEILRAIAGVIVGKGDVLERILAGILASGHILIEDYPGLAKTLIARLFAQALGLSFKRLQCTPDLLPADVTGSFLYDQREARFEFRPGPIFTNLLLADEINRATPKTQAALLEAMQEAQVTVEGESFRLEPPFLVIATQNPIELEGTYPLPEAQLDRFLIRVAVGYPSAEEERRILERRRQRRQDEVALAPVVSRAGGARDAAGPRGRVRGRRRRAVRRRPRAGDARRPSGRARRVAARRPGASEARARRAPRCAGATSSHRTTSRRWPARRWPIGSSSSRSSG